MNWHILSTITLDGVGLIEMMAAANCDGIGVIARWVKKGNKWEVSAIDTESGEMELITDFGEEECVPYLPPE